MSEWKEYRIGEICETQTGPFGSQLHNEDYVAVGTPIVTVEHLGCKNFTTQNLPFVSDEDSKRLSKYTLKEGDIVFSRVGSVDRCSYVSAPYDGWLFSGRCLRVRPKDNDVLDSQFLYYHFSNEKVKTFIRNIAVGATMPSINTKLLNEVPISLPSLSEQKKIADILSSLDEKIETNRKINARLEELAQAIFKSWFIDFESFGGKMPEDWSLCKLEDITIINSGKRPIDKKTESILQQSYPIVGASSIMGYTSSFLYNEPILVIGRVGTHGVVQRWNDKCWPSDNTLVIKSKYYNFVFNVLTSLDYNSLNRGSTQPLITQSDIKQVEIISIVR
ncbi:MAG: restriction endonuclease subunit S [Muribaculaceae bacterium]|nr:restriction endonuclease subunit S [Muribaculaceae bacterium]